MQIKSLIEPFATWTGYFGLPATVRYTFKLPTHPDFFKFLADVSPYIDFSLGPISIKRYAPLIELGMRSWEKVANVTFIRDDNKFQIPIYQYVANGGFEHISGCGALAANYSQSIPSYTLGIGFEANYLYRAEGTIFSTQFGTILHEIGHAGIGFKHPFEDGYVVTGIDQKTKSFSVMNYNVETIEHTLVYPITPMPADIEAAQYVFGPNLNTGNGDNLYLLSGFCTQGTFTF